MFRKCSKNGLIDLDALVFGDVGAGHPENNDVLETAQDNKNKSITLFKYRVSQKNVLFSLYTMFSSFKNKTNSLLDGD